MGGEVQPCRPDCRLPLVEGRRYRAVVRCSRKRWKPGGTATSFVNDYQWGDFKGDVDVAAEASEPLEDHELRVEEAREWVATLSSEAKDECLAGLMTNSDGVLRLDLVRRFREEFRSANDPVGVPLERRTVGELLVRSQQVGEDRYRVQEENAALERAAREREAAIARERYLG